MKDFINQRVSITNLAVLIKFGIFGVLVSQSYYFAKIVGFRLGEYTARGNYGYIITLLSIFGLLSAVIYLLGRGFLSDTIRILKSYRFDVFVAFCFGIFLGASFGGDTSAFYAKGISLITDGQLMLLALIPIIIGYSLVFRVVQLWRGQQRNREKPFFINDIEQETKKNDLLGFAEEAERFADRVFNRGSADSMVFGIDAPWGIGKSTFVNFCKEYWENNYKDSVIVYNFSPLRYENRNNLLEKFIDGLIQVIQKNSFVPEIRTLIHKYSRFIKEKVSFSAFGFQLFSGTYTIDDAFEDLKIALLSTEKKVLIVVDDLDRLSFSSIKDVLFAIKKSFTLPNISYVLCYDAENISMLEKEHPDIEKVTEFLEKFVNVKIGLFVDAINLQSYVSENLEKVLFNNSQADSKLISKAVGGLTEIYKSPEYHLYLPFIGDVRKLKRLINTLMLLEIEKADFENSDFDSQDLMHLLLIYINYPNIFRKIYNTETQDKRGFFSAIIPHDDGYPENASQQRGGFTENSYKNSIQYTKYIGSLSEKQAFLLNKVFNVETRLENTQIDSVPEIARASYACFNGGWTNGRTLEQYLKLITRLSKPQNHTQYKFYLNCKNEIVSGKEIEDVLSKNQFLFSNNEHSHEQFWRIVTNNPYEFDRKAGEKLINYLADNIQNYSLLTSKDVGLGLRDDLAFFLSKLLDVVGWTDESGGHRKNSEENVAEIAEWIFGEKRHVSRSILDILSSEGRGLLGLYDLLVFRLSCSADRGGDNFNLGRALSKHSDVNAPTQGSTAVIVVEEMREISQRVFQIFMKHYGSKNIFELADSLTLADFTGKYHEFAEKKIASGEIKNIDEVLGALRSRVKSFIVYQLGNSLISSGVGCGYYDPKGKADKNIIKGKINDYLFKKCFNPKNSKKNYEHFFDYLLINFASVFASEKGRDYIPHPDEFTKVLERGRLINFWKRHRQKIKALRLTARDKTINATNYVVTYKDNLKEVYDILDNLVKESRKKIKQQNKTTTISTTELTNPSTLSS